MKNIIKNVLLTIAYLVLSSNYSISGTIDPNTPDSKYVEYGKDFKYIYKICGSYADKKLFCASAVAIDSHWIVTAAHVVKNSTICIVHQDGQAFIIDKVICHEDFDDNSFGVADIALGYISEDIGLEFYPSLYEDNDEVGQICCISGYGLTGTFNTGISISDDKRRAGSNIIDKIDRDLLICSPSLFNKTSLEFIIATGDSGGGLFIKNKLAGINSCVLAGDKSPNSSYGDESGHTRISKFVAWIKNHIESQKK
jgi:hypothetical protein